MSTKRFGALALFSLLCAFAIFHPRHQTAPSARPGLLMKWEKALGVKQEPRSGKQRKLAADGSTAPVTCLKDRFNVTDLRADIQKLEASAPLSSQRGLWHGVALEKMPAPQARFLIDNEQWIQSQGLDFTGCSDAICILTKVYEGRELDALATYWWYLRMGYVLSSVEKIPGISANPGDTYTNHLFGSEELAAFWDISYLLSDSYRTMSALQSFHRLGRGLIVPSEGENTCGLSTGSRSSGHILLMDKCLDISGRKYPNLSPFLYTAVVHEMSHNLDRMLGRRVDTISTEDEWKAFSKWSIDEGVDPATKQVHRQWRIGEHSEGFVRDYAGTNPIEDFADSSAFYRMQPRSLQKVAPGKFAFIRDHIYHGRSFLPEDLTKSYGDTITQRVLQDLPELTRDCLQSKDDAYAGRAASYQFNIDFPVSDTFKTCIGLAVRSDVLRVIDDLKMTEYEACDLIPSDQGYRDGVVQVVSANLNQILPTQKELASQLQALTELQSELALNVDPREAYLSCYDSASTSNTQDCYDKTLTQAYNGVAAAYEERLASMAPEARQRYLKDNDFNVTRENVYKAFEALFFGVGPVLKKSAAQRWAGCSVLDPSMDVPLISAPFSGGAHYVASSILSCLNRTALDDVSAAMDRRAHEFGLGITSPTTRAYLLDILKSSYLDTLKDLLETDVAAEEKTRSAALNAIVDAMADRISHDTSWVGSPPQAREAAISACIQTQSATFAPALASVSSGSGKAVTFKYTPIIDYQKQALTQACQIAWSSIAIQSVYRAYEKAQLDQALQGLDPIVLRLAAKTLHEKCGGRLERAGNESKRKRCLQDNWKKVEASAKQEWLSGDGASYGDQGSAVTDYFSENRDRLQFESLTVKVEKKLTH